MSGRSNLHPSGRSAAWLARLPWEQEVECSNHSAPTIMKPFSSTSFFFAFRLNFRRRLALLFDSKGNFLLYQNKSRLFRNGFHEGASHVRQTNRTLRLRL